MQSRQSLIDLLLTNPHGWGNQPPRQQQPAYQDDAGNSYGFDGSRLDRWRTPQEQPQYNPSLVDSLVNIATSPAKLAYGMVAEPYNALARLGDNFVTDDGRLGLPNPQNPENQTDMATLLMTGFGSNAFRGGRPGVVSSGPVASAERVSPELPMDHASRLARAREQGFDTDKVWYHGSNSGSALAAGFDAGAEIHALRPSANGELGPGVYLAPDQEFADYFARGVSGRYEDGSAVYPVYVRGRLMPFDEYMETLYGTPYQPAETHAQRVAQAAQDKGYAGFGMTGVGLESQIAVFDPSNIRSVNAAFDPANASKNGLLLSDTGRPSLLGSALAAENANYLDRFRY